MQTIYLGGLEVHSCLADPADPAVRAQMKILTVPLDPAGLGVQQDLDFQIDRVNQ